jgi:ribokinase
VAGPYDGYDLVFFVSGTVGALRAARAARFLAATLRELPTLRAAGVPLDLLVGSAADPGEPNDAALDARTVVLTEGEAGGTANGQRYAAVPPLGPVVDSYGAGDSFAAAVAFALARGHEAGVALELAARAGAAVLTGRGPYTAQISA